VAVAARAIDDGSESWKVGVGLERAGGVGRRVRAVWPYQLRGGEDDNEDDGGLFQSSGHGSSMEATLRLTVGSSPTND
jgi:hypothetical protein